MKRTGWIRRNGRPKRHGVIDESLLDHYRGKDCWFCLHAPGQSVPHHVHEKGLGCAYRLDATENLAAVCWKCHSRIHSGHIRESVVLAVVAYKMDISVEELTARLNRMFRESLHKPGGNNEQEERPA